MLRYLRKRWIQAIVAVAVLLFLVWIVSFVFGITQEICEQTSGGHQSDCRHYNLAPFVLIQIYNALNGASTLITAIATAVLTYVTYKLVRLGREQSTTASRQIEISGQQADIQLKQQQIERLEFIATHRPRLRVRRIDHVQLTPGTNITAKIEVSNIGGTNAHIRQFGVCIFFREKSSPASAQFNAVPTNINISAVPPGNGALMGIRSGAIATPQEIAKFQAREVELCALGIINYGDDAENRYVTSFFRVYRHEGGRFFAAPDDPYEGDREYED